MAFSFDQVVELLATLRPVGATEIEPRTQSDADLLRLQTTVADAVHRLEAIGALLAAEIAHRSRRELGQSGLAYRAGFRSPEKLIQHVTGSSGADARKLVRVGSQVAETLAGDAQLVAGTLSSGTDEVSPDAEGQTGAGLDAGSPGAGSADAGSAETGSAECAWCGPWHAELGRAVASGRVSVDAADGIRRGLGEPGEGVSERALRGAVSRLIEYAGRAHVDAVWVRARNERDLLDPDGIAGREQERRDARYLRLIRQRDGMTRISGLLDPESAQHVVSAFDAISGPRRGGPRFLGDADKERARRLLDDPRTLDQIMADALVDIVDAAVRKDTGRVFGTIRPTVRIVTTIDTAERGVVGGRAGTGSGYGVVLGQTEPVSVETVQHHLCTGHSEIVFDGHGHALHHGRDKRTFTTHQREVLAVRDGGCMWPDCDRPPDWCEAHHINEWLRDTGNTDIDDGILLCRSCHLRLHNDHWRITRQPDTDGGADRYLLHPPDRPDPSDAIHLTRTTPHLNTLHHAI